MASQESGGSLERHRIPSGARLSARLRRGEARPRGASNGADVAELKGELVLCFLRLNREH